MSQTNGQEALSAGKPTAPRLLAAFGSARSTVVLLPSLQI